MLNLFTFFTVNDMSHFTLFILLYTDLKFKGVIDRIYLNIVLFLKPCLTSSSSFNLSTRAFPRVRKVFFHCIFCFFLFHLFWSFCQERQIFQIYVLSLCFSPLFSPILTFVFDFSNCSHFYFTNLIAFHSLLISFSSFFISS